MVDHGSIVAKVVREIVVEGKRLGCHREKDPRSKNYRISDRLDMAAPLVSKEWTRRAPVFDQGSLGSCTGNGTLGVCGTEPFDDPKWKFDETFAVAIYAGATDEDTLHEPAYPPNDRGSTVLGALKAARLAGLFSEYRWSFSVDEALQTLSQHGPLVVGFNWYEGFDSPDGNGVVHISGNIRGGHCWEISGLDVANQMLHCWNSWSPEWGLSGGFKLPIPDFTRLVSEEGEVGTVVKL